MSAFDLIDGKIRALHDARFKEFETETLMRKDRRDAAQKVQKVRGPRETAFLEGFGVDPVKFGAAVDKESRLEMQDVKVYLDEVRPKVVSRRAAFPGDAKEALIRASTAQESGHLVLPPYAATIYTADRALIKDQNGELGAGAIDSGWVIPDDPRRIRIRDYGHVGTACFESYASPPPPEFSMHFGFVPASTARFEMTAVVAFHGFYILRSNDSWWNCRHAFARLKVQMNVHQYSDLGWKSFPALINRSESNVQETTTYDRAGFFDYTAVLKAGDPVVVTVRGTVDALGVGGGTYAELNFEAGTANYIQPLLLSVAKA